MTLYRSAAMSVAGMLIVTLVGCSNSRISLCPQKPFCGFAEKPACSKCACSGMVVQDVGASPVTQPTEVEELPASKNPTAKDAGEKKPVPKQTPAPRTNSVRHEPPSAELPRGSTAPVSPYMLVPKTRIVVPPTAPMPGMHVVAKPEIVGTPNTNAKPTDTKPAVRYDRASDYSWVMGQLEYLYSKKVWRVRFSPPEVDDAFGGTVTLVGAETLLQNYQNGQMVRVDGALVHPGHQQTSPAYTVKSIRVLKD